MSYVAQATSTVRRSARFVPWARAWRAGLVPCDDAAEEIAAGEEHLVTGLNVTGLNVTGLNVTGPNVTGPHADDPDNAPLSTALSALSRLYPDEIRLVLPAPGDPRGLPAHGPFSDAALQAGEGIVAGGIGIVPQPRTHTSGSGDTFDTVVWHVLPLAEPDGMAVEPAAAMRGGVAHHDEPSLCDAEQELSVLLTEATTALARLDVAQWRPELAGALTALRRPDNRAQLPPGYPPRARRLYDRARILDGVLALAEITAPGGAITGSQARERQAVLRPLASACRRALVAACNSPMI